MGKRSAAGELFLGNMGSIQRETRPSMQREDQLTMETKLERIAAKCCESPVEERSAVNPHATLCVQSRLVCSAGDKPAGAKVSSSVVRIAGWRETKILKPIDNVSLGEITSHRAVTKVNA